MEEMRVEYDSICYATFINVKTLSSGAERICFKNFDYKNKEHKFVLAVTMACWTILDGRDVAVDAGALERVKLSKKYRKLCKIDKIREKDKTIIDTVELIEYMKNGLKGTTMEGISFGEIYDAYYNGKE